MIIQITHIVSCVRSDHSKARLAIIITMMIQVTNDLSCVTALSHNELFIIMVQGPGKAVCHTHKMAQVMSH